METVSRPPSVLSANSAILRAAAPPVIPNDTSPITEAESARLKEVCQSVPDLGAVIVVNRLVLVDEAARLLKGKACPIRCDKGLPVAATWRISKSDPHFAEG